MKFLPSQTDRAIFGKIASEYDLVYFGQVDPRADIDYDQIRGITVDADTKDENYTTGDVYDYNVTFLQRAHKICRFPSDYNAKIFNKSKVKKKFTKKKSALNISKCSTTILQVKLHNAHLPHVFISGRSRLEEYEMQIRASERWQEIAKQNLASTKMLNDFANIFAVFIVMTNVQWLEYILNSEAQAMLATHFTKFDYEIFDDKILVYCANREIDVNILSHMLRIGLWWARELDRIYAEITANNQ